MSNRVLLLEAFLLSLQVLWSCPLKHTHRQGCKCPVAESVGQVLSVLVLVAFMLSLQVLMVLVLVLSLQVLGS